jgi:hypothetical protein
MRKSLWPLLPFVLIAVIAAIVWRNPATPREPTPNVADHCPSLNAGCTLNLDGRTLRAGVTGPVRSMQPFEVWVEAGGTRQIEARFIMKAMDMGVSTQRLVADARGIFRGQVTLAACVSGDRDWVMALDIDGRKVSLPFVMEP